MQRSQTLGRIFVAVSLVVFGVQHFMYGASWQHWCLPLCRGVCFGAYFVGVAFVAAPWACFVEMLARPAATMLA